MPVATVSQSRPDLSAKASQQIVNAFAASLVSHQIERFAANGTLSAEKDLALVDATGGAITIVLPLLALAIIGKPYIVKETSGSNGVTVDGNGSETIDGSANYAVGAGNAAAFVAVEHPTTGARVWHSIATGTAGTEGLLAANNLSDLANAATARTNLDVTNKIYATIHVSDLLAANTQVRGFVYRGPNATITKVDSVLLDNALGGGDATLTARIETTPVTDGVITIAQSASAVGDKDTATPSAANAVVAGDWVNVLVGGANTQALSQAGITIEFTIT